MSDFDPEAIYQKLSDAGEPIKESTRLKKLASSRAWKARNKKRVAAYGRSYFQENGARINADRSEIKKRWWADNRESALALKAEYRKRNLDAILAANAARRALKRGAAGRYTKADIAGLFKKQGGACVYCRTALGRVFHRDHITPLIAGGSNFIENIQLLCATCNLRKNKKDPITFAREIGRLL